MVKVLWLTTSNFSIFNLSFFPDCSGFFFSFKTEKMDAFPQ